MSLEEKIVIYKELQAKIKELEEEKQKIYQEILASFPPDEKELLSDHYRVKKYSRFTIKTTLDEARPFKATKMEEIVDKDKIKQLVLSGLLVPNVTEANYFFIHNLTPTGPVS